MRKFCKYCGTPFEPTTPNQLFCNTKCYKEFNNLKTSADPVVDFFSKLKFNVPLFDDINAAGEDPDKYAEYFKLPDLLMLNQCLWIITEFDPNKEGEGYKDHLAFLNMMKWMMFKMSTHPIWLSYIAWLIRISGNCQHPSSYWPIRYSDKFTPDGFFKYGEDPTPTEVKKEIRSPADVFKFKKINVEEELKKI
jgi:hypothetical protein